MPSVYSSVSQTSRSSRSSCTSPTQEVSSSDRYQPSSLTEFNLVKLDFENIEREVMEKRARLEGLLNKFFASLTPEQLRAIADSNAAQLQRRRGAQANSGEDGVGSSRAVVMTTPLADAGARYDWHEHRDEATQSYDLRYAEEVPGAHLEAPTVMYQADGEYAVPAVATQPVIGYGPCQCEECVQVHGRVPAQSNEYEYTTSQVPRGDDLHEGV